MLIVPDQAVRRPRHRRRGATSALVAILAVAGLYVVAPRVAGVEHTWQRIRDGSPAWLAAAVAVEALSFLGYVWLLRRVATCDDRPLPWGSAWRATLAGVAATRVVTFAGAGGIAVTILALRGAGFSTREAAERQAVHLVALYACFFGAMVVDGALLAAGGGAPLGLSVGPALLGAAVIGVTLAVARVPATFERWLGRRFGRRASAAGALPAVLAGGVRGTMRLMRAHDPALGGALAWWTFDIAALWASLHAFGGSCGVLTLVMAYLAGHAFNVLPVPGGVGPVEGGIIAVLVAFGQPASLALVAVLSYQLISVWLPAAPGVLSLLSLRHAGGERGAAP